MDDGQRFENRADPEERRGKRGLKGKKDWDFERGGDADIFFFSLFLLGRE